MNFLSNFLYVGMKSQKTKTIISIFFDTSNTPLENKLSSVESSSRKQQNIIYLYIECDSIRVPFVGNTINQAAFYNGTCFKNYVSLRYQSFN